MPISNKTLLKDVLHVMWPLVFAMAANTLMMFVDRLFLARYSATSIQAAVPAGILAFIALAFLQNVTAYSGTFVAQYAGSGARAACARAMGQGIWLSFLCLPILAVSIPLGNWALDLIGHAPKVLAQEKSYYLVLTIGNMAIPFIAAVSGFYSGLGRTRLVMVANLIGNALNIALDPWFIWGGWFLPEMGILGAGLATASSQFIVLIILLCFVFRERHLGTLQRVKVAFVFKPQLIGRIIRFGIPSGAHVFLDCATFTVFVFLTGRMCELDFAVSNIAFSINHLIFGPLLGIAMASSIVVGQRMGEGDSSAAARAGWISLGLAMIYVSICVIVIGGFCTPILELFLPSDATFSREAYFGLGKTLVAIFLGWAFFDAVNMVIGGALKGAGDTRYILWAIIAILFGFWIPMLFIAYFYWGIVEMWLSLLVYVALLASAYGIRFVLGKWKTIQLINSNKTKNDV